MSPILIRAIRVIRGKNSGVMFPSKMKGVFAAVFRPTGPDDA